jgi:hypothetical protein
VKERGIPMMAEMVRATMAGRKRQTRRLAKMPDWWPRSAVRAVIGPGPQFYPVAADGFRIGRTGLPARQCHYGVPGDRLWVREAWRTSRARDGTPPSALPPDLKMIEYLADGTDHFSLGKYRPAMYMPRWASRLTLEVTEVRLEKLRSISAADARAEGFEPGKMMKGSVNGEPAEIAVTDPVYWFAMLWTTIHGEGSYADDPWVWAVSFRLLEGAARAKTRSTTTPTEGGLDGHEER